MNFLALVNRARRECGEAGTDLTTFLSLSVTDQRFQTWVAEAWHDVQLHRADWDWMRKSFAFDTVVGTQSYTPTAAGVTDLADWKRDTLRSYLKATGTDVEYLLPFMDYETFRNVYLFGVQRGLTGQPVAFTINPSDKSLLIGPTPSAVYTINGSYFRTVTDLANTTDDPSSAANGLDARWHMLIVYRAMEMYATYEAAPEVMQRAEVNGRRLMNRLEFDQAPALTFGPPLA